MGIMSFSELVESDKSTLKTREESYRRGYMQGMAAAMSLLECGMSADAIDEYIVTRIANWRASNTNAFVLPPAPVDDESEVL